MQLPHARRWPLIGLLALLMIATVMPAAAAKPQFMTIPVNELDVLGTCDGFDVLIETTGTVKVSTRITRDDLIVEIARYRLRNTFSNAETGASITTPNVGIDKVTINQDGSATLVTAGLYDRVVVPGEGVINAEAGRLVLFFEGPNDPEPDVLFESGPTGDLLPALCSALD